MPLPRCWFEVASKGIKESAHDLRGDDGSEGCFTEQSIQRGTVERLRPGRRRRRAGGPDRVRRGGTCSVVTRGLAWATPMIGPRTRTTRVQSSVRCDATRPACASSGPSAHGASTSAVDAGVVGVGRMAVAAGRDQDVREPLDHGRLASQRSDIHRHRRLTATAMVCEPVYPIYFDIMPA